MTGKCSWAPACPSALPANRSAGVWCMRAGWARAGRSSRGRMRVDKARGQGSCRTRLVMREDKARGQGSCRTRLVMREDKARGQGSCRTRLVMREDKACVCGLRHRAAGRHHRRGDAHLRPEAVPAHVMQAPVTLPDLRPPVTPGSASACNSPGGAFLMPQPPPPPPPPPLGSGSPWGHKSTQDSLSALERQPSCIKTHRVPPPDPSIGTPVPPAP